MNTRIEKVIDQWFRETEEAFKNVHTANPIDILCTSVTALTHNYCSATLSLLNKGHRLPAMALLRVLAELAFRLVWCLYEDNPREESCDVRIKRWLKTGFLERKKYVQRKLESNIISAKETDGFRKELEELEKKIGQVPHSRIGNFYDSLRDLPEPYRKDLYPLLYNIYNWGIHPDFLLLTQLVKLDAESNIVVSDIDENPTVLKIYCLTLAYNILFVVRRNYEWDCNAIKSEYLKIKKDFSQR